jgi:hypothetical protein
MNEDDTDYTYTSLENSWDIHPNEDLLAKYWAAKEMAASVYLNTIEGYYWQGHYCFTGKKFIPILTQILKKEWFK